MGVKPVTEGRISPAEQTQLDASAREMLNEQLADADRAMRQLRPRPTEFKRKAPSGMATAEALAARR